MRSPLPSKVSAALEKLGRKKNGKKLQYELMLFIIRDEEFGLRTHTFAFSGLEEIVIRTIRLCHTTIRTGMQPSAFWLDTDEAIEAFLSQKAVYCRLIATKCGLTLGAICDEDFEAAVYHAAYVYGYNAQSRGPGERVKALSEFYKVVLKEIKELSR